jgi:lincosamide nucleotidyltransferase A/C/D/E
MTLQDLTNGPRDGGPEMTAGDVVDLARLFDENHIPFHVDGGWGVDALLGGQTRRHADLDIAIQHKDAARLRALLEARGWREVPRDDSWECNFVLGDGRGRQVDVHSYTLDPAGKPVYGVPYPGESLSGVGTVNGHPVRCISPEWLVRFHSGYRLDENDERDVGALCRRFGIPLPPEFQALEGANDPKASAPRDYGPEGDPTLAPTSE